MSTLALVALQRQPVIGNWLGRWPVTAIIEQDRQRCQLVGSILYIPIRRGSSPFDIDSDRNIRPV